MRQPNIVSTENVIETRGLGKSYGLTVLFLGAALWRFEREEF